jgi:glycosyltransferase involved in cell wall biosynthesis
MTAVDINGRFLTQATTGVQRYATQIVGALDRELAANEALRLRYDFRLLAPRNARVISFSAEHIPLLSIGRLTGQGWEQLELPKFAGRRLLLNLCNTAPLVAPGIVVIHDASVYAVPEAYSFAFRTWYRMLLPRLGARAVRVLTGSEFSRSELTRRARIPSSKIKVLPLGGEHILQAPADRGVFARLPVQPGEYLLTVGSRSPHKNVGAVSEAVARLPGNKPPIVVVGGANPRVFRVPATMNQENVHSAGYVTDGELRALYENAIALVFPSLYEGFGLPPLEAMACGCPAVVANVASMPEVCGNAVLYCDPLDPDDMARQIVMIGDPGVRNELRNRGIARARCFTWKRSAETLVTLLDGVQSV